MGFSSTGNHPLSVKEDFNCSTADFWIDTFYYFKDVHVKISDPLKLKSVNRAVVSFRIIAKPLIVRQIDQIRPCFLHRKSQLFPTVLHISPFSSLLFPLHLRFSSLGSSRLVTCPPFNQTDYLTTTH